ncbi:MAG: hypothetical protein JSV15_06065 [Candidatus Bathyarchaeota archaeon]|nr:MAG: hypothetical protein JSV15_06065 [Candidatus Bathyarchaeota archaeon]
MNRKAEENAHNVTLAFLIVILGTVILIGGLLLTVIIVQEPRWLLFVPYQLLPFHPYAFLGLILTSTGFPLTCVGFILVVHYYRKRSWSTRQLEKSEPYKKTVDTELRLERIRKIFEEHDPKKGNV